MDSVASSNVGVPHSDQTRCVAGLAGLASCREPACLSSGRAPGDSTFPRGLPVEQGPPRPPSTGHEAMQASRRAAGHSKRTCWRGDHCAARSPGAGR